MVKIRAVSDAPRSAGAISSASGSAGGRVPVTTSPQKVAAASSSSSASSGATATTSRGPGRPPGVSMVTLTANGVVRKVPEERIVPDVTATDGGSGGGGLDMDDITEGDVSPPAKVVRKR